MQKALHYQEKVKLPTYKVLEEDILPALSPDLTPRSYNIYPYKLQEIISKEKKDEVYDSLILENKFFKLTFLPQIGGRLISAYDKRQNRELFYRNPALKPVLAGLTGAWCGTGVEFNFPGSHSVTSNRPVACSGRSNPDGSASVIMSDTESISGMRWRIKITLYPDKYYIEQESCFSNSTDVHNRGYFWTNAKVEATPDTSFIFPCSCKTGSAHPPMDVTRIARFNLPYLNGIDLGKYKNVFCHLPLFLDNIRDKFFGCYDCVKEQGIIHYADYGTLPGRKIWTLGRSDDGLIMNHRVNDEGTANIEIQSGPLWLQTDFMYMEPGKYHKWNEYWLPLSETGRILNSNLSCSIGYSTSSDGKLQINIFPYEDINGVSVYMYEEGRKTNLYTGNFFAGQPIHLQTAVKDSEEFPFKLQVVNEKENDVISFSHDNINRPELFDSENTEIDEREPEALFLKGLYKQERGDNSEADEFFNRALQKDPTSSQALLFKGINEFKKGQIDTAKQNFKGVLRKNRRDPGANYYLGLCLSRNGDTANSIYYLRRAAFDRRYAVTATFNIAIQEIRSGAFVDAWKTLENEIIDERGSLTASIENIRLLELAFVIAGRKQTLFNENNLKEAIISIDPQNILVKSGEDLKETASCNLRKQNTQHIIMLANFYISLALYDDALSLLRKYSRQQDCLHPIVGYTISFLAYKLNDAKVSEEAFKIAESQPVDGINPFSYETYQLLKELDVLYGGKALKYYIGVLLASFGDWQNAYSNWESALNSGFKSSFLFRAMGLFNWKQAGNMEVAAEYYLKGFEQGRVSYKYIYEMNSILRNIGRLEERERILNQLPVDLQKNSFIILNRAELLFDQGKFKEVIDLLAETTFSLYEGKRNTVDLYINANIALGIQEFDSGNFKGAEKYFKEALAYPWNLGVGRSVGCFDMKTKYWLCKTIAQTEGTEKAVSMLEDYIKENKKYSFGFKPLKMLRWEEDKLEDSPFTEENILYQGKLEKYYNALKNL